MHKKIRKYLSLALLAIISLPGLSQSESFNSPYSSFGLGDMSFKGFTRNRGMGGISLAVRDNNYIDFSNPASYTSRDSLSMLFEFGSSLQASMMSDGNNSETPWDMNFSHMAFSFPITSKMAFGAGLIPYTSVNYKFIDHVVEGDPDYNPEIGGLDYLFKGNGGVSQIFFGTGIELSKNFSLGVNANYFFGNITNLQSVYFTEEEYARATNIESEKLISGFNFNAGLQYSAYLGKDWKLVAGGKYSKKSKLNFKEETIYTNSLYIPGAINSVDTLNSNLQPNEKRGFPSSYGLGLSLSKGKQLLIGADYRVTNWNDADLLKADSLANSSSMLFGLEYTPKPRVTAAYPLRMQYRTGAYYTKSYLMVGGEQLNDFGITFGLGFPIGRLGSSFNLAFDYGQRGIEGLVKENHGMISFSLSLYDLWFVKFKYQ